MFNRLAKIAHFYGHYETSILFKIAGKIDDLKKQLPHRASEIEIIAINDPTPTKKYLEWGVKQLISGIQIQDVLDIILEFHNKYKRLINKDINSYTYDSLKSALSQINDESKTQQKKQVKIEGADRIYEDDRFVAIHPKNKDAVCAYGKSTRWCITQQDSNHYEDYSIRGVVFYYIIDKTANPNDPMYKIAIAYSPQANAYEIFNAIDNSIQKNELDEYLGDKSGFIWGAINNHAKTEGMKSAQEVMMNIAENGTEEQKYQLAQNPELPIDIANKLLNSLENIPRYQQLYIKTALATNQRNEEVLRKLFSMTDETRIHDDIRLELSKNQHTPKDILMEIADKSKSGDEKISLALNPSTPSQKLEEWAKTINGNTQRQMDILYNLMDNKSTPTDGLLAILNKKIEFMVEHLAQTNTNPIVLETIFNKYPIKDHYNTQILMYLADNLNAPPHILDKLSKHEYMNIRRLVARNHNTSPETLNTMIYNDDEEHSVILAIITNPNTPKATLMELLNRDNYEVKTYFATREGTSKEILSRLSRDKRENIRHHVARNKTTPLEDLYLMESNPNEESYIRQAALDNFNERTKEENKLATLFDYYGHHKIAKKLKDILRQHSNPFGNEYIGVGQKTKGVGSNADQDAEVPEEINDELEAREMDGRTEGMDNWVVDKNSNPVSLE